jgi:Flp pilus assembly protein TadD
VRGPEALGLAVLGLAAFALRAAHLCTVRDSPLVRYLFLDPLHYDSWGRRIAGGEWLGDSVFFQDPAYAYLLGMVYRAFGPSPMIVASIQSAVGSLLGPVLFLSARRWLGAPAAWAGAAIASIYPASIYYDGLIEKTSMATFLIAATFWALSGAVASGRLGLWFTAGLLFAVGCLARGNLVLVLPVLAAWALLDPSALPRTRLGGRRAWAAAGSLVLGAGLVLGATALRNRVAGGFWVLTTSNAGQNFYIGNNPLNTTGEYAPLPFVDPNPKHEEEDFAREAERRSGRRISPPELSRFWFREALGWIRANPGAWLRLSGSKLRNFTGAYEIPDSLDYYLYREHAPVLRLPLPGFGWIAPLGLLGIALCLRKGGWTRAVLLFVVVYSASVLLFFVFSRFRMPIMPALFLFAGHALVELARGLREALRSRRLPGHFAVRVGLLLTLAAAVNLPVRAPRGTRSLRLAESAGLPVRPETTATGHYNLGLALAIEAKQHDEQGQQGGAVAESLLREAEAELRESLRQDASHAQVHVELGKVLARLGRNREAIEAYRVALRLEPRLWQSQLSLGILYGREGDLDAAANAFRQAAALAPQSAFAQIELGETLLELGRADEAVQAFRTALRLQPGSERARAGLEEALRSAAQTRCRFS